MPWLYSYIFYLNNLFYSFLDTATLWFLQLQYYALKKKKKALGIRTSLLSYFFIPSLLSLATLSHCSLHFTIFPHSVLSIACVLGEPSKLRFSCGMWKGSSPSGLREKFHSLHFSDAFAGVTVTRLSWKVSDFPQGIWVSLHPIS